MDDLENLRNILLPGSGIAGLLLIGAISWAWRSEKRQGYHSFKLKEFGAALGEVKAEIEDLRTKHEKLDQAMMEKLSEIGEAVARLEGYLKGLQNK